MLIYFRGRFQKELANLNAMNVLFEPSYKIGLIVPLRKQQRSKLCKLGELGRLIFDAQRCAEGVPLVTRDLVATLSVAIG